MSQMYNVINLPSVDSTNNYAKGLLKTSRPAEFTVISTDYQTGGRGQGINRWYSENERSLTFSMIFYPGFLSPDRQYSLSQCVAAGICDFLNFYCVNARIKWPNDIIVADRKIAGILIENSIGKDLLTWSVAGIGLNVNQTMFPEDLSQAVSMRMHTGQGYKVNELLPQLIEAIICRYRILNEKPEIISRDFHSLLYRLNQQVVFSFSGYRLQGVIQGVDNSGRLLLKTAEGIVIPVIHGEGEWIPA